MRQIFSNIVTNGIEFGDIPPEIIRKDIVEDEYVITIPIEHPLAKKEKINTSVHQSNYHLFFTQHLLTQVDFGVLYYFVYQIL